MKIERGEIERFANFTTRSVQKRYETVKVQKKELALKLADQQTPLPRLSLYHQSGSTSRSAFDHDCIAIQKPVRSATRIDEEESKHVNSAVTLYNVGLVYHESGKMIKSTKFFDMALRAIPQSFYPSFTALILYSSAQ
eukprot:13907335-Ditylum_brightwellii.AAC.1